MVTFTVAGRSSGVTALQFRVHERAVMLAGSRNGYVDPELAGRLIDELASRRFSLLAGCATGVDACFRLTIAEHPRWSDAAFVACAFADRVRSSESRGLFASVVVSDGLSPAAALRRRTLWMVKRAEMLVLFPVDPMTGRWGRGSTLAFRAASEQLKPVFVASSKKPPAADHYELYASRLCEVVDGWWAVPHPIAVGTCDEEV